MKIGRFGHEREYNPDPIMERDGTIFAVEDIDYHRNGSGDQAGFHVVLFTYQPRGSRDARRMVGVCFEERDHTAVFDRDLLGEGNIQMFGPNGGNAWRGDHFAPALRKAIDRWNQAQDRYLRATT